MKHLIKITWHALLCIVLLSGCSDRKDGGDPKNFGLVSWEDVKVEAPFDMPPIRIPVFPENSYNIKDYGALEGNKDMTAEAIAQAITACHEAGGGTVVIPEGKWLTAKVHFKSNVNLHISEGAELVFSDNPQDYLPAVQTSWEGMECFNYSPLIYAFNCKNIAITGKGTLRAEMDQWEEWFGRPPEHMNALKELYHMAAQGVPVKQRQMAVGENNLRPHFIQFNRCENVLIEDIKIRNSPFWTVHLFLCNEAVVRRIDVYAHGHNNDGIDPEMTQNLLVEDCIFDQGDDAIAIKAGRNQDAWRLDTPSKNIVVRNCTIIEGHQLLAIGSEMSGGVRNVYVHDCQFPDKENTNLSNLVFIKTNERRGGFVKDIYVENIKAGVVRKGVLGIATDVLYQWKDIVPTYEKRLSDISEIHLSNIEVQQCQIAFHLKGERDKPIGNVYLNNIQIGEIRGEEFDLENVVGLTKDGNELSIN